MQTDGLLTSRGGTSDPVGHIGPEDQQIGEFQKKPIKEEEPDDEYFYGGTSSFVGHLIPVDQQDEQEKHMKEEEPEDDNKKCSTDNPVRDTISCSFCPLSYTSQMYLFKHIRRSHHDEYETLKKPSVYCENMMPRRSACSRPEFPETLQANTTPGQTQKGTDQSSDAEEHFTQQNHLDLPGRIYAREKPFYCSQCGKNFTRKDNLRTHQRVHTGEKPLYCADCGRSFSLLNTLQLHQRIQTGEKPYYWSDCGRSFNQVSALKRHQRIHVREKPCHCSQSERSFSDGGQFEARRYVHTDEKPYDGWKCFEVSEAV